jgi:hypothetical protein
LLCWWLVRFAGAFVVLVISLRWWCCCAGDFVALVISLRWWFRCDFIALEMLLCWWWFRCPGGEVSCVFVNCCSGAFAETKKRFVLLLQSFALRSPGTWIHSGSWLPSCWRRSWGLPCTSYCNKRGILEAFSKSWLTVIFWVKHIHQPWLAAAVERTTDSTGNGKKKGAATELSLECTPRFWHNLFL